jgi:hypothetical protein
MITLSLMLISPAVVFLIRKTDAQHNTNRKRSCSLLKTKTDIIEDLKIIWSLNDEK